MRNRKKTRMEVEETDVHLLVKDVLAQAIHELTLSIERTIDKKFASLNAKIEKVMKENESLKRGQESLRDDFIKLEKQCEREMKGHLENMRAETRKMVVLKAFEEDSKEQEGKGDGVKILGIKEGEDETLESLATAVEDIAKMIGANVAKADIREIKRVGQKRPGGKPRSIVAKLNNKSSLMGKKKDLGAKKH